jgi:hypothetical protein
MRVNSSLKPVLRSKPVLLYGMLATVIAIFFIATSFTKRSQEELFAKQVNLTIREIGHHLLLKSGDSTSRVLPVKEISPGVFLLRFENELVFKPDTLVTLTQRILAKSGLPSDYTVTVHECRKPAIVYGFQVSPKSNNIEACRGRIQPRGCYTIQIAFADLHASSFDYSSVSLMFSGFILLIGIVLVIQGVRNDSSAITENVSDARMTKGAVGNLSAVGKFMFDISGGRLLSGDQIIDLTEKEGKILELLNEHFGQLTTREDLIQKIWTDEGVVTGRSLDMFVSKLRKKLSGDSGLRITNIHGKGYKLEVVEDLNP